MSYPQVPYDPLLDTSYKDLPPQPGPSHQSTPRITAQDLDDPVLHHTPPRQAGVGGSAGMAGVGLGSLAGAGGGAGSASVTDFGLPAPHFLHDTNRASTYSTSTFDRQSAYGSIAPLREYRDSAYRDSISTPPPGAGPPPGGDGGGYAYPPVAPLPGGRYTDDPTGRSRGGYYLSEKDNLYEAPRAKTKRKGLLIAAILCVLVVVAVAVAVPVYLFVIKKSGQTGTGNTGGGGGGGGGGGTTATTGPDSHVVLTSGGDGSTVIKEDGTTFVYNNSFGGIWVYDVNNPLNNSAQAQSYTPPLSSPWQWGVNKVFGVNLGGWLNLEPFITPALYEPFNGSAVDEWTLSTLIQQRDGNLDAIENHYATFITEEDFAQITAAGLNWVRIPLPFWAIETYSNEPFLARTSWSYFLKAIQWARKYGLRINLDFHAAPGSQNGWNHSGKLGEINFLNGVMGVANAQRGLDYIRILAEFISQPEYRDVIPFFGILNEPNGGTIPENTMKAFYAEVYRIVRTASGAGQGNGPVISFHEAFFGLSEWVGFLQGADRIALDSHPYLVFGPLTPGQPSDFVTSPCNSWAGEFGGSMSAFGITAAGEWSYAINDCGLYVNAVGEGTRYEGTFDSTTRLGSCDPWNDYGSWNQSIKDGLRDLSKSTMDSLGDWFFWTWTIGPSLATGKVEAPFWSYKLSLEQGWAVTDPRTAQGMCASLGLTGNSFYASNGSYSGAQIGVGIVGDGLAAEVPTLGTYAWPPTAIGGFNNAATLPTYTATGPIVTLPVTPSITVQVTGTASVPSATATVSMGNGWNNPADQASMQVPIPGCAYPNQWDAISAAVPSC